QHAPAAAEVAGPRHRLVLLATRRLPLDEDPPALHAERPGGLAELRGGHLEKLRLHLVGGQPRGVAGHERGPARVGAGVPWAAPRVRVHDVDALERHPQGLGDDHGQHRLRALADLAGAGDKRDLAEVVELHDRAAPVRAVDARAAADVEHAGVAHATLEARYRRRRALGDLLRGGVETLAHRERREREALRVDVAGLRRVTPSELEPIDPELVGEIVHLRLDRERGLRVAVAAHRAGIRIV